MTPRGLRYYSPADYLRRGLWALVQPLWRCSPRWCWGWRRALLRLFGAQVARGVRVYPAARLHQPWHLVIGPRCTIAWNTTLYALGPIRLGADVVISQGAHLCAGDHDIRDPNFPVLKPPITLGDGVWIAADAFIGPGVVIGERAVVGARAVVMRPVPAAAVVAGNPARVVGQR
jgi:putative colanic acid biosynthesis acetyltransferase WcaF